MKKVITLAVFVVGILVWRMGAMNEGQGSGSEGQEELVILKTNDESLFRVPKARALLLKTIKDLLEDAKLGDFIPLSHVSSDGLKQVMKDLDWALEVRGDKRANETDNDAIERAIQALPELPFSESTLASLIEGLKAADFLQVPELVERYASEIAFMLTCNQALQLLYENNNAYITLVQRIDQLNNPLKAVVYSNMPYEDWIELHSIHHDKHVQSVKFSPDGSKIVTASHDKTAKIVDVNTGRVLHTITYQAAVRDAEFSPNGTRTVIVASRLAEIVDVNTPIVRHVIQNASNWVTARFSPDGTRVLAKLNSGGGVAIADANTRHILYTNEQVSQFSQDGSRLVATTSNSTADIVDAHTGQVLQQINYAGKLSISPDGRKIIAVSRMNQGLVEILNANTGQVLHSMQYDQYWGRVIVFSQDGSKILVASHAAEPARIIDINTGQVLHTLEQQVPVDSGAFSLDGRKALLVCKRRFRDEAIVKIIDVLTGQVLTVIEGYKYEKAAFSPDGSKVVTLSIAQGGAIQVVDVNTGEAQILRAHQHEDWCGVVAEFSPDGNKMVITSPDNSVKILILMPVHTILQTILRQLLVWTKRTNRQIALGAWGEGVLNTYASQDRTRVKSIFNLR